MSREHVTDPPRPPSITPAEPASTPAGRVPWSGRDVFLAFFCGGLLSALLSTPLFIYLLWVDVELSTSAQLGLFSIVIYGSFALCGWFFALRRRHASKEDVGLVKVRGWTLLMMLPLTFAVMMINAVIVLAVSALSSDVPTAQEQILGQETSVAVPDLLWLILAGVVLAPIVEEFLFRGLLYRFLRKRRSRAFAIVVTAAVFAIAHLVPALIPSLFVFGIFLAWIVERYGSLYPAMALHSLNNLASILVVYSVNR
ncbi:MAG: lysostaphin resistance A-like protein [Actinomycetota bacterium]